MLLMGTRKQFDRVIEALLEQGFGCKELSIEIGNAIRRFESAAEVPSSHMDPKVAAMFRAICRRTLVMGVLNVTPDSFSDGGLFDDPDAAIGHACEMAEQGADIIDIGGESSRPGSEPVSVDEEIRRVVPVIEAVAGRIGVPISVDTYKVSVAVAASGCGGDDSQRHKRGDAGPRNAAFSGGETLPGDFDAHARDSERYAGEYGL